jgi:uncharacterized protein YjbJ (UPF0337 family)
MHDQDTYARAPSYNGSHEADDGRSKAAVAADTAKDTAKDEARNVAGTAKEQTGAVVGEARGQVRRLATQAKGQATDRVRGQHNQMVDRLRGLADEFQEMGGDGDSPGKALVGELGQRGRRVADYLADRGPEGLVTEVTDFARRRPFAFLSGAVAAGFLVGRLGKNIWKTQQDDAGSSGSYRSRQPAHAGEEPIAPVYSEPVPADPYVADTYTEPIADPYAERVVRPAGVTQPIPPDPYPAKTYRAAPVTPAVPPRTYPEGGQR